MCKTPHTTLSYFPILGLELSSIEVVFEFEFGRLKKLHRDSFPPDPMHLPAPSRGRYPRYFRRRKLSAVFFNFLVVRNIQPRRSTEYQKPVCMPQIKKMHRRDCRADTTTFPVSTGTDTAVCAGACVKHGGHEEWAWGAIPSPLSSHPPPFSSNQS